MAIGRVTSGMINNSNNLSHLRGFTRLQGRTAQSANNQLNDMLIRSAVFVTHGATRATQLKNTLAALPEILNRQSAVSQNNDVFRVASFTGTSIPNVSIEVSQIATNQRNAGQSKQSDAQGFSGTFTFQIEAGNETRDITITIDEPVNNRVFMERVAEAINNADIGVRGSVTNINNQSALTLSTTETGSPGENPRFLIRDLTGDAVERLGIGNITEPGQDAIFRVNGEERVSRSNTVNLGSGLTVELLSSHNEAVSVIRGRDENAVHMAIRQIISQVNGLLEVARENPGDTRTRNFIRQIEAPLRSARRSLRGMGIEITREGFLSLDDNALRNAVSNGTTDSLFSVTNNRPSGFLSSLSQVAHSMSQNPTRHISPHAARLPAFQSALEIVRNQGQTNTNNNTQPSTPSAADIQSWLNSMFNTTG